jgi:hypothetical protein
MTPYDILSTAAGGGGQRAAAGRELDPALLCNAVRYRCGHEGLRFAPDQQHVHRAHAVARARIASWGTSLRLQPRRDYDRRPTCHPSGIPIQNRAGRGGMTAAPSSRRGGLEPQPDRRWRGPAERAAAAAGLWPNSQYALLLPHARGGRIADRPQNGRRAWSSRRPSARTSPSSAASSTARARRWPSRYP